MFQRLNVLLVTQLSQTAKYGTSWKTVVKLSCVPYFRVWYNMILFTVIFYYICYTTYLDIHSYIASGYKSTRHITARAITELCLFTAGHESIYVKLI